MAVPSRRHKAGAREIRNRESRQAEEKRNSEKSEDHKISQEEHEARLKVLRDMGLIK